MFCRLFAYGTLRHGAAPDEIACAVARLSWVGGGVARGRRFNLGAYPGAVFAVGDAPEAAAGFSDIHGEVYEVPDAATLGELDAYEGFEPSDPAASLFIRRQIDVMLLEGGERVICWAYEYNRPVEFVLQPAAEDALAQIT